jgi:hypothetical protein
MILSVVAGKGTNLGMLFVKLAHTSKLVSEELKEG